jgi:dTDP-4-amino-4,6-dideoxygalactose transaminase
MSLRDEDVEAVLETLRSGWLTMGPRIQAFEAAFADWVGVPHAVAVSSGTAALHLALLAAGCEPGDRVIVPAFGSRAAADAARFCGAEPVFADVVSAARPVLDVVDVERRIGDDVRAVVAAHTWGHPADADLLRDVCDARAVPLIEDCRAALGSLAMAGRRQVGTIGLAGCFSLGEGRQISVGEGGVVTTADDDIAARVRLLRAHAMTSGTWDRHRGHSDTYDVVDVGFNFRLDEPRAALATSRLSHLREDLEERRAAARRLRRAVDGLPGVTACFGSEDDALSGHGAFGLLLEDAAARDAALERLRAAGVQVLAEDALAALPHAQQAARRALALAPDADPAAVTAALG